jgi:hypothetical protein
MKRETYRDPAPKEKAKLTPVGKTFLDELPVHGELLIFAERSVDVQSETIHPDEVCRKPAGHLIEVGWTWQRAGNAMHKSWDNCKLHGDLWSVNPGSPIDKRRDPSCSHAVL